jgi:ketosteroid isomerase-like protein
MNRTVLAAMTGCVLAVNGVALVRADAALDAVLAADRDFAARSFDGGTQSAFLEYLAADSVLFRPTAVNGREWLQGHEEASGRLEWSPAVGAVACDGQLAVTVGPWTYRQASEVATGYYLTVWRRDASDDWKVVLDQGIDDAPTASGAQRAPVDAAMGQITASWSPPDRECGKHGKATALAVAERELNDRIHAKSLETAMRAAAGRHRVVLRDDHSPAAPSSDWPKDDTDAGSPLTAASRGVYAAPGSDMGYSYGDLVAAGTAPAPAPVRGVYIRVWTREADGWRIAMDLLTWLPVATGTPTN